jgi:hypothetical protein
MDRFVNRQNIERYRRLAIGTTNATERLQIMKLLAEEEAKFKLELRTAVARQKPSQQFSQPATTRQFSAGPQSSRPNSDA